MLKKASELVGRTLHAIDGEIGEIRGFYFDDKYWIVRYLIVDTSPWFTNRQVIISPTCFKEINWDGHSFPVDLTREQVKHSPSVEADKPVSLQEEEKIIRHFGWPEYWNTRTLYRRPLAAAEAGTTVAVAESANENPNLRDTREVMGYAVHAMDGDVGSVEDFIVDDSCWQIRYLLVSRFAGRRFLVSPEWIDTVSWNDSRVVLCLSRYTIDGSPPYDAQEPVSREYEDKLYDYYKLPKYWRKY